jgi:hypothetical protein
LTPLPKLDAGDPSSCALGLRGGGYFGQGQEQGLLPDPTRFTASFAYPVWHYRRGRRGISITTWGPHEAMAKDEEMAVMPESVAEATSYQCIVRG